MLQPLQLKMKNFLSAAMERDCIGMKVVISVAIVCWFSLVFGVTDPQDLQVLLDFQKGLDNPELLKWPSDSDDPCGPPSWPHIFCSGSRVSHIHVQNLGLSGTLPPNFNCLSRLFSLDFERNNFSGKLPTFSGLSELQYGYLSSNHFDTIPSDFFDGLHSLQVLTLDYSPLNETTGWSLPLSLQKLQQLMNLSLIQCNVVGPLPDFLGQMGSLKVLKLSHNRLSGEIPSSYARSNLQILWLNNQEGRKLSGPINVIAFMTSMEDLRLQGNQLTGRIPPDIGNCSSLTELLINDNKLIGLIPDALATLRRLRSLRLDNNMLTGPIPKLTVNDFTYSGNSFCQPIPDVPCSPEITALLDFLRAVNYPPVLSLSWSGNDPCSTSWFGISCSGKNVTVIILSNLKLNGTLSPSIGRLDSLEILCLGGNNLRGVIPEKLTSLKCLKLLNFSGNDFDAPLPVFHHGVRIWIDGNPKLRYSSRDNNQRSPILPPSNQSPPSDGHVENASWRKKPPLILVLVVVISLLLGSSFLLATFMCYQRRRKLRLQERRETSQEILPFDLGRNIAAANNFRDANNLRRSGTDDSDLKLFSFATISAATDKFSELNKLGQGGFGPVYKGKLLGGQEIAVKRLSRSSGQGLEEFKNEIILIAKLQHMNLVRLLGCCIQGCEKILIYEYMPNKSLDSFLFDPTKKVLLYWGKRVHIIEGIAQGLLYLRKYSRLKVIHRDLKTSDILLDGEMNPKISDFGMARIFRRNESQANTNKVVDTYGYMSPEYAMEALFSIKSDVFSFGVVLLEIVSGRKNNSFFHSDRYLNLLGYAWELWEGGRVLELMDPMLGDSSPAFERSRCIHVGLLCVQEHAADRPTMSDVVSMLGNESITLPTPKQPAFSIGRIDANANLLTSRQCTCSVNDVTLSEVECR